MRARVSLFPVVWAVLALSMPPQRLLGQPTLTVTSSTTVDIPTPAASEYAGRYSVVKAITYEVSGCDAARGCTVGIWAVAYSLGYFKPVDHLQWRTTTTDWTPLSTIQTDDNVAVITSNASTGTLFVRMSLSWATDAPDRTYTGAVRLAVRQR